MARKDVNLGSNIFGRLRDAYPSDPKVDDRIIQVVAGKKGPHIHSIDDNRICTDRVSKGVPEVVSVASTAVVDHFSGVQATR